MNHHYIFKRLENDIEFRTRVFKMFDVPGVVKITLATAFDQHLDDLVWDRYKIQRKIVEDEA